MHGMALDAVIVIIIAIVSLTVLLSFFSGPFQQMLTDTFCFFNNNVFSVFGVNLGQDVCVKEPSCRAERIIIDSQSKEYLKKEIAARALLCWDQKSPACGNTSVCYEMVMKKPLQAALTEEELTKYLEDQGACGVIENSRVYDANGLKLYPGCGNNDLIGWEVSNYVIGDQSIILIEHDIKKNRVVVRAGISSFRPDTCSNNIKDSNEEGVDCGGPCDPCIAGKAVCETAAAGGTCNALDATYGAGYRNQCCSEHGFCCILPTTTIPGATTTLPGAALCDLDDIVNSVSKANTYNYLNRITNGIRAAEGCSLTRCATTDSSYNKQTRDYIESKLNEFGLDNVHIETFSYGSATGYNVVGEVGSGTREIIMGGHRDSHRGPGAVDNGAGTVIVMEIARVFASKCKQFLDQNNYKVTFALFDSEELGILGSRAYVQAHSVSNVQYMINFDCTSGYDQDVSMVAWVTDNKLSSATDECGSKFALPIEKTFTNPCGYSCSDYAPFAAQGVTTAFPVDKAASGELCAGGSPSVGGVLHSSADTLSVVDQDKLVWGPKYGACVLRKLLP